MCSAQYFVSPVTFVVEQRVSDVFHVYTYLMCAACFQLALNKRYVTKSFQYLVVSNRRLSLFAIGENAHLHPVFWVTTDIPGNGAFIAGNVSPHQCRISPFSGFVEKLCGKVCFGIGCFSNK
ncbi:hypothetical protein SDC9_99038 [bioreactor metagenome]|uniref:Uncharacterized protein n=1 Tax=bioreactor metagenome TaxID=1076179 RepID=A0A645AGH1_9ZZZZ